MFIVGSPAYWEKKKKNVMAMIRQFGLCNFFITLSAAETRWPELIIILSKTVDDKIITHEEAKALPFKEKARLIQKDPISCALYFNRRFQLVRKTWNHKDGPFMGHKILHYFYRIEFQHRGSPHVHMILWIDNVPKYKEREMNEKLIEFIDKVMTSSSENPDVDAELLCYQYHNCKGTCKRIVKGKQICRFNAPFLPMDRTRILEPLPQDQITDKEEQKVLREKYEKIRQVLKDDAQDINTFEEFLERVDCTLEEYIQIVKFNIKQSKVFLKRTPKDSRINGYNSKILSLMRSNIDIQHVNDAYKCIRYVVDYVNKSARGLSRLVKQCVEDFEKGNHSTREKLKAVANVLYNSTEISAQEAAWKLAGLKMSECSRVVEFICTGPMNVSYLNKYLKNTCLK